MLPSILPSLCSQLQEIGTTLWCHSRDEAMEAQKDQITYLGSHRAQL